eukprot:jgi/Botrbrau1/18803/Bobra.0554s0001.6
MIRGIFGFLFFSLQFLTKASHALPAARPGDVHSKPQVGLSYRSSHDRALSAVALEELVNGSVSEVANRGDPTEEIKDLGQEQAESILDLATLADPEGLMSCLPICPMGSTCAFVMSPDCALAQDDNTGSTCGTSANSSRPSWICLPCKTGDYCPANSIFLGKDAGRTDLLMHTAPDFVNVSGPCPGGTLCPTPNESQPCPPGYFCPAGASTPVTCNLSSLVNYNYTLQVNVKQNVLSIMLQTPFVGNYCPINSSTPTQLCPPGYYCPTPLKMIVCPKGYFCRGGSQAPWRCTFASECREGAPSQQAYLAGALVAVFGFLLHAIIRSILNMVWVYRQAKERQKVAIFARLFGLICAQLEFETSTLHLLPPPSEKMDLGFQNLSLALPSGQVILEGVTGSFSGGRLAAVMGPSGCGKSTFLSLLAGKPVNGRPGGRVLLNGVPSNMSCYRPIIGFVPQDDILCEDLTVRENLLYSSYLRLPPNPQYTMVMRNVAYVLQALQLVTVQNSLVGSVARRGISGGQRKRVNIGYELVALPALLFADEPTSGLDSAASRDVTYALHCMSRIGYTIVAVIHQPRYSVFAMFDELLLLGKGGSTVYQGPTWLAAHYFSSLGWQFPAVENPGDFLLDIVTGTEPNPQDPSLTFKMLPAEWKKHERQAWLQTAVQSLEKPAAAAEKPHTLLDLQSQGQDSQGLLTATLFLLNSGFHISATKGIAERWSAQSSMTEEALNKLLSHFSLEAQPEDVERLCTRARLARRHEGTLTVQSFVEFLISNCQSLTIKSTMHTRKVLERQHSFLRSQGSASVPPRSRNGGDLASPLMGKGGRLHESGPQNSFSISLGSSIRGKQFAQQKGNADGIADHDLGAANDGHELRSRVDSLFGSAGAAANAGPPASSDSTMAHSRHNKSRPPSIDEQSQEKEGSSLCESHVAPRPPAKLEMDCQDLEKGTARGRPEGPPLPEKQVQAHDVSLNSCIHSSWWVPLRLPRGAGPQFVCQGSEQESKQQAAQLRQKPGFFQQLYWITRRSFLQWSRHLNEVLVDNLMCVFVAYLLGVLLLEGVNYITVPITALTASLAFALISASASLRVFSRNRPLQKREKWAGLRPLPFFLGKLTADLLNIAIKPLIFSVTLYVIFPGPTPMKIYYPTFLLVSWWTSCLGYAISIFLSGTQALLVHIVAILVFGVLLAGVNSPNLVTLWRSSRWLFYLSELGFNRWAVEALSVGSMTSWPPSTHHLMLERLLDIGFCGNQEYGYPSMQAIAEAVANATHVHNITEGLHLARPQLGDQVVDSLSCTFRTQVTFQSSDNCIEQTCGRSIARAWIALFAIGVGFCAMAYVGLTNWLPNTARSISRGAADVLQVSAFLISLLLQT